MPPAEAGVCVAEVIAADGASLEGELAALQVNDEIIGLICALERPNHPARR